jgi:hypothetical protein
MAIPAISNLKPSEYRRLGMQSANGLTENITKQSGVMHNSEQGR